MSTTQLVHLTGDKDRPEIPVSVESVGDDLFLVTIDGVAHEVEAFSTDKGIAFRLEGRSRDVSVDRRDARTTVVEVLGQQIALELIDHRVHQLEKAVLANAGGAKPLIKSPMAGKVIHAAVEPGAQVEEGDLLVIVEAMKMENEIRATGPATVASVAVTAGDVIEKGALLVTFVVEDE